MRSVPKANAAIERETHAKLIARTAYQLYLEGTAATLITLGVVGIEAETALQIIVFLLRENDLHATPELDRGLVIGFDLAPSLSFQKKRLSLSLGK